MLVDYPRNKIGTLMIAAHGYAVTGADGKAHDGFGMQLCKEDLDMNSVHYFRALDGLFESHEPGITLLGCGVAAQERVIMADGGVETGFGHQLCKAIAMATSTGVKASTSLQSGDSGEVTQRIGGNVKSVSVFDPGRWEGDVSLFKPDGTKSKVTNL